MQAMGSAEITKVLDKYSATPNSIVYLEHEEAIVGPVKVFNNNPTLLQCINNLFWL